MNRGDIIELIHREINNKPGISITCLAKKLGVKRNRVESALPSLEYRGLLVSEDNGCLYPFDGRSLLDDD